MILLRNYLFLLIAMFYGMHNSVLQAKQSFHKRNTTWRQVQDSVRDGVVQIFAQRAEFDFIEPYRTPKQYVVSGSGFFISEQGEIITNAHVVQQAIAVLIQMPAFGKHLIRATVESICPDRDLARLRVSEEDLAKIKEHFGRVPYLHFGDSDLVRGMDEAVAVGYPLGQESIKFTNGVISGREIVWGVSMIQMDTPINPGNSGGPLINNQGEVIGINTCGMNPGDAQNVNYAIPINDLKLILPNSYDTFLIKRPSLGVLSVKGSKYLTEYLGNPQPGGCFVTEVIKGSPVDKAGLQHGDMVYEINGNRFDIYGETSVSWSDTKISLSEYVARLRIGEEVDMVVYRHGERIEMKVTAEHTEISAIQPVYPWYEVPEYEVFAGMVVMPLTQNHIKIFHDVPGLQNFMRVNQKAKQALLITHIFSTSELGCARAFATGFTLATVNGEPVHTLDDFRQAIKKSLKTGILVMEAEDQVSKVSNRIPVVLPFDTVLKEVVELSRIYNYPISDTVKDILEASL